MSLRVACIQIGPVEKDPAATLAKVEEWLDRAGAEGVQVAVLPEGLLPAYAAIQEAKASGDAARLEAVLRALEPIPGPATERVAAKARQHGMVVAFGMLGWTAGADRPSNTSILFDRDGRIVNVHRKIHLTPVYEADDFGAGSELAVSETSVGRCGNMVCADYSLPETSRILAIKGAELLLGSLAGFYGPDPAKRDAVRQMYLYSHTSPTRAIDNSVFMVMCNMCGWDGGLEFFGRSRIIDPRGVILAEGDEGGDREQLVIADLDLEGGIGDLPFRLIDRRRPDLYGDLLAPNPKLGTIGWSG